MALKKNEKIGVFVAVVVAFGFMFFSINLLSSGNQYSFGNAILSDSDNERSETGESLNIEDVLAGDGEAAVRGSLVTVNYVGMLEDGTEFDSSRDRGPFSFLLGAGQVIEGWDMGVEGMKVGGVRVITIPPELAYGSNQVGPIPPNSTLIFEIELLSVEAPQ